MGDTTNPKGDVKTPEGTEGLTPTKTLTPEVEALVAKANATLTDVGRIEAELRRSQSVANAALSRLKEMEEDKLRMEEAAVRDDPERLSVLRLKREAIRIKGEAEAEVQKVESERAEFQTQRQEIKQHRAERFAEKYSVAPELLLKYGGESKESMEELAKSFGERTKPSGEPQPSASRMTTPPEGGKTRGTPGSLTIEAIRKMSPEELIANSKEIAKWPLTID